MNFSESHVKDEAVSDLSRIEGGALRSFGERGPRALALAAAIAGMTACSSTTVSKSIERSSFGQLAGIGSYCDKVDHLVGKGAGSSDSRLYQYPDGTALVQGTVNQSGEVVASVEITRPDGSRFRINCDF